MLAEAHKETRKTVCSELLEQYGNGGDDFLARIVTGDETWLHHFSPETKKLKLKESLRGTKFQDDDSLVNAAKLWLRRAGSDFYRAGIQALVPRWRKAVEMDEDYVEK
ncbi:hypothetical protein C0J52_14348 [Blattella germanica]|nr:hypothetical protein C0J52_14348 [Blattella germanica]